jgi:hypothetical protein
MRCPVRKMSQSKTLRFQMQLEICNRVVIVDLPINYVE